jgi:hypothetical protein
MTDRVNQILSGIATALSGFYVAWTAYALSHRVPAFVELFLGLGTQLPVPVRAAIILCRPGVIWPVSVFLILVLVLKEFLVKSLSARVVVSVVVFMATAFVSSLVTEALLTPLLDLIRKLG